MISIFVFFCLFCIVPVTNGRTNSRSDQSGFREEGRGMISRDYYGGFGYGYPYLFEPLTVLAVLGFIAFIIQTAHGIYQTQHNGSGLLNNILPGTHRTPSDIGRSEKILNAIEIYEALNKRKKAKRKKKLYFQSRQNGINVT